MKKLIIIGVTLLVVYQLTAHIIHKIWNISSAEAKQKINEKIRWFFSSPEHNADIFLSEPEARELGNKFLRYFTNIRPAFFRQYAEKGIVEYGYRTAGMVSKYEKSRDIVAQSITMDIMDYYMMHRGFEPCIRIKELTDFSMVFMVAYNQKGIKYLQERSEKMKEYQNRKMQCPKPLSCTLKFNRRYNPDNTTICIGCYRTDWVEKQQHYLLHINLVTHPHLLLTGASGSGKSYCLNILLYWLSRTKYKIWLGDYKASKAFSYFKKYPQYAAGNDVEQLINKYYELFDSVRTGTITLNTPQVLILDEYPGFIQSIGEKKRAEEIKSKISTLLMMGRNIDNDGNRTQFCVWITAQRADASIFSSGGARDNFMTWIALGNLSSEAKHMISNSTLPDTVYQRGEGIVKIDGKGIEEIIVPKIRNFSEMTANTKSRLF